MPRRRVGLGVLLLLAALPGVTQAQFAPVLQRLRREPLPPFDKRLSGDATAPAGASGAAAATTFTGADARATAARELAERVRELRIVRDPISGSPAFIGSTREFLPARANAAAFATAQAGESDPVATVRSFIDNHSALFGHGAEALEGAQLRRNFVTRHNGMRTIVWQQHLDGLPVFEATLAAHLAPGGELVNISSRFVASPESASRRTLSARASLTTTPPISARDAVAAAARNIGAGGTPVEPDLDAPVNPGWQRFRSPEVTSAETRQVWLPMEATHLRLAWEVICTSQARAEMFRVVIDAETGEPVIRHGLTEYISNASYNVFTSDSPSPFSPGHSTPSSAQPATVSRTLVTLSALNTTASPNGWIDDGITETRGNNVDAHTDTNADNLPDLPRPQSTGTGRVFDPPLDLALAPSTYRDAATVNLFYWCNWIHDQLYELGFDEASGNFQNNNFGRGGLGNDAIQADAQDGSGTDNANFSSPPDGSPGRMQMYIFTGPTPDRDGDFDTELIIHEYTHGLSNRLVGGGLGLTALASRGMGEGWSDFYGLALLSEAGDSPSGNYAMGGYATHQLAGLTQNYYFGIRRYPYSTDMTKNPLTFKDTATAQASPHTGIPRSPSITTAADAVHNTGEVWCVTLWEARANLIAKHGFTVGNKLILQLVTDGMKLAPANPNFLQGRDAIIQADLVANGGANRAELWAAFAKRGMGAYATAPASTTTAGLVENFDLPDDLSVSPSAPFAAAGMIGGPFTPASTTYTLLNSGSSSISWTAAKTAAWITLSNTAGTLAPGASTTVTATLNASAAMLGTGAYTTSLTFTNASSGAVQTRLVSLDVQPITVSLFSETFESGTLDSARWTVTGTSTHRTQVTTLNAPHGGTRHLTMDSSAEATYARNEATLTLDLSGQSAVRLKFWAKMFNDEPNGPPTAPFVNGADFDGVAISADGTNWYEVQPLRDPVISNSWAQYSVDLDAAIAARGLSYNSTFRIRFNHYDNYPITTDGFAIDDIDVLRLVNNQLSLTLPASLAENGSPATATLAASPVPTTALTVALSSSLPSGLNVPSSIIIPAGTASVTFQLTPTDDSVLNGTRPVTLAATAAMWAPGTGSVALLDNETATLSLSAPTSVTEGATGITGTLTSSSAVGSAVSVQLESSLPASLQPPGSVTIPAGQSSVSFPITVPDDNVINGSRSVTLTASVANWTSGTATVSVLDNENTSLAMTAPAAVREGDTGLTGTVRIAGIIASNLTVTLASADATEILVPGSVTIPAGQTSVSFPITVVDDGATDGAQAVLVTATANGFTAASATLNVADNDVHHFAIAAIASPQTRNAAFNISVTAQDVNNVVITNHTAPVTLSAANTAGAVPVTPTTLAGFANGVWTGPVTITAFATAVKLTVSDDASHTGQSNAFDVTTGSLHHFVISPIGTPQITNVPFNVTITAQDAGNNPVSFNGSVNLAVVPSSTVEVLSWTAFASGSTYGSYAMTKQAISTYLGNYTETATSTTSAATLGAQLTGKHVLLIPAQELSTTGTLGPIGTAWTNVLTNFVTNGGTVIACSWNTEEHQLLVNAGLLSATRGTSSYTLSIAKAADTPLTTGVSAPFTGSYISTYSGTTGSVTSLHSATGSSPVVFSRTVGSGRAIMIGSNYGVLGTPLDRVVANAVSTSLPTTTNYPVTPSSATLAGGVWTGAVSVGSAGNGIKLSATSGAAKGESNVFSVTPPPTLALTLPTLRESNTGKTGTVTLSSALSSNLTIALSSSDTTELVVPASVVIPAGQLSASFSLSVPDDTLADGPQPVTVTASGTGVTTGTLNVTVNDNDADHFSFATIASPQLSDGPIPLTLTALDSANAPILDYDSPVTLTATGASGALTITPATSGTWQKGVWTGFARINAVTTGVVITASDGQGHTGSSAAFSLVTGSASAFAWDALASPQSVDTPFNVTVRAVDSAGSTVTNYHGAADFFMAFSSPNSPIGTGANTSGTPFFTYYHDSRATAIYLANELDGPARITGLALNVYAATSEPLTNFTIRLKHTTRANFKDLSGWDNTGWTTVYRASPTVSAAGWMTFQFTTPFDYDGLSNLAIDWSMDRTSSRSIDTYVLMSNASEQMGVYGYSNSSHGDPLTWTGSTPYLYSIYGRANIRFSTSKEVPIRPVRSSAFSSGVWTGQVSLPTAGSPVALRARAGGITGLSNNIDVNPVALPSSGGASVFSEDFESGVLSSSWTVTGTGAYRTAISSAYAPHGGTRALLLDSAYYGTFSRNEATITLNLAGRSSVSLSFWARSFGDAPHGPPAAPFPSTGADFDGVAISADGGANWYEVQGLRSLTSTYTQYTVNLDTALATRGLSYSSNFKIRFNQYGNDYVPWQGIGIDDVTVTAAAVGFAVTLPPQGAEGGPALTGTVRLDTAQSSPTVVTLGSTAPAKASVPASLTIPTGQLTGNFTITLPDDTIFDGDRVVGVMGNVSGLPPAAGALLVIDNDAAPLSLVVPPTVAESDGSASGTLSLAGAVAGNITVALSSSLTTTLTVPASVTFTPGQTTQKFPITILNNYQIDGSRPVTITASIGASTSATGNVTVTDDESAGLSISVYGSIYEGGSGASGYILLGGAASSNLTVALTSSKPSRLTVPASITITAGSSYGYFTLAAPDNTATDGSETVVITASATGLLTASTNVTVRDNDVHHFSFGAVASPRTASIPFSISISARDVNDVLVETFSDLAALSATGDSGSVALAPGATSPFSYGSWTGNVTIAQPDSNVRITASVGAKTGRSDPFAVLAAPTLVLNPASVSAITTTGGVATRDVTLTNSGGGTLTWNIPTYSASLVAGAVSAGPVFTGAAAIVEPKDAAAIPAPAADYVAPRSASSSLVESLPRNASGAPAAPTVPALSAVLANLNSNGNAVRSAIPGRYAFSEGVTGNNIIDGGNDMYDGGNYLGASLIPGSYLTYSDNAIASSALLGSSGQYFTRKLDGLFVFAADVAGLSYFEIVGNLGADGSGSTDTAVLSFDAGGATYRGFVKRVYQTYSYYQEPSVNHLIIVPDNGTVTHEASKDTNNDYHRVTALAGVTRIYYLLYAGTNGAYIDNASAQAIMAAFMDAIASPNWVVPSATSGSLAPGASQTLTLTLGNPTLAAASYARTINISSNDPARPVAALPLDLTVTGASALDVFPNTPLASRGVRGGPFSGGNQTYTLTNPGATAIAWTASKTAAWLDLSSTGGTLAAGGTATLTVSLNSAAAALAPSTYTDTVTLTNTTNGVGTTTRAVNLVVEAQGELAVGPANGLDADGTAGGPFNNATVSWALTNTGDAPLSWSALKTQPWLALSSSGGTLAAGASVSVTGSLNSLANALPVGAYRDTIVFTNTTNGLGNTSRPASLAVRTFAPVIAPEPVITGGSANTIAWNAVAGAGEYEVQAADNPSFTSPRSSGWIAGTSHAFGSLNDGQAWYFRVRARQTVLGSIGQWTQTAQSEFDLGSKSSVETTGDGKVKLALNTAVSVRILNPSFEANYSGSTTAANWAKTNSGPVNLEVSYSNTASPLPTEGTRYATLWTDWTTHSVGEFMRISQSVDFTGINTLMFDAVLTKSNGYDWANAIRAEVRIDGTPVWSSTAMGAHRDQSIDVSALTGIHVIDLGCNVIASGTYGAQWACFDNLRTSGTQSYVASGTLVSPLLAPSPLAGWGTLQFSKDVSATGTSLTVDVLNAAGSVLAANVSSGADLNALPSVAGQTSIKLRANLATTNPAQTPQLHDWTISYFQQLPYSLESAWSPVVSSTQDSALPSVAITSVSTASATPFTVSGTATDASGIATLTVNGAAAVTSNSFANWTASIPLVVGPNAVTVVATDKAAPGNVRTINSTVTYSPASGTAPAITTQPAAQTVNAGSTATFSVVATGSPAPGFQWRKDGVPIPGATSSSLLLSNVQPSHAGAYSVAIANTVGALVSAPATLTVNVPAGVPAIVTQPVSQLAAAGTNVTFTVGASGTAPLAYSWRKNGTPLSGANASSLTVNSVQTADAGAYSVEVSNTLGSALSNDAKLTVIPAGFSATQSLVGRGYQPGANVTVATTLTYAGTITALGYQLLLPAGWSYVAGGGDEGSVKPSVGDTDVLSWAWSSIPASPVTFTTTLHVPAGASGPQPLIGLVNYRPGPIEFVAQPDPLMLGVVYPHSADFDQNFRISLVELTRLIELYNTRNGTSRTGSYNVASGTTEDGFEPDPSRAMGAAVVLARYHSADCNPRDGRISLVELTRMIELYNYRAGTSRTGEYHEQSGTEDGFAPGP